MRNGISAAGGGLWVGVELSPPEANGRAARGKRQPMGERVAGLKRGGGAPGRAREPRRRVRTRGAAGARRGVAGSRGDAVPSVPRMAQKENVNPNLSRLAKVTPPSHSQGVPFVGGVSQGDAARSGGAPSLRCGGLGVPPGPPSPGVPSGWFLPSLVGGGPRPWGGSGFTPGPFGGRGGMTCSWRVLGSPLEVSPTPGRGVPPLIPTLPAVRGAGPSGPPAGAL